MANKITQDDLDLLGDLGIDTSPEEDSQHSRVDERLIAGFEDICRFVDESRHAPQHGDSADIFEKLYAVRLSRIRENKDYRELLKSRDRHSLLADESREFQPLNENISDEEILSQLGVDEAPENELTQLVHVPKRTVLKPAEDVAVRKPCRDFETFRPLFESVKRDLESEERYTYKYKDKAEIKLGELFILDGQTCLVAEMGVFFQAEHGRQDCRLRVIFDNETESDLLLRSLQRGLNKDKTSRRISLPKSDLGPLFSEQEFDEQEDISSGYIYVLRSKSEHPFISKHRDIIHKIGVTGGDVKRRIAIAPKDATYLLADVDIIATYKLTNINKKALENLIHSVLCHVKLDIEIEDRFGNPVKPEEWFLAPLSAIDDIVAKIQNKTIGDFKYNPDTAKLERF